MPAQGRRRTTARVADAAPPPETDSPAADPDDAAQLVAAEEPRRYQSTHAFDDWPDGEMRERLPSDPRTALLAAAGFIVPVD